MTCGSMFSFIFHSGSGVFKCSGCSISFRDSDRAVMEKHCVSVHAATAVLYRCPACPAASFPRCEKRLTCTSQAEEEFARC